MTKVYIAGPMTGYPEYNYPAFNAAEADLFARGYEVLNPVSSEAENATGSTQTWQWYMRRALRLVSEADGIALLTGHEKSKGARLEKRVGEELGLDIRELAWWLR